MRDVKAMRRPSHGEELLVACQPVLDTRRRVVGYRITYARPDRRVGPAVGASDSVELFKDVLGGIDELVGSSIAHLPISLMTVGVPPIRPDRVVLRVRFQEATKPVLALIFRVCSARGYSLELDAIPGLEVADYLLDLFPTVEVDLSRWSVDEVGGLVARIARHGGIALASGVRSHAQRAQAEEMGFELFVGPYYATANVVAGRKVPVGDLRQLVNVARLHAESASLDKAIDVIGTDIGLTVRLLRYINSAHFGLSTRISSIRQAAVLLGARGIARWALLIAALDAAPKAPAELRHMALRRARMCQEIAVQRADADPEQMFMVGLLSMVDALLGAPLDTIVRELPLGPAVSEALLNRTGAAGRILNAVIAYEDGTFFDATVRQELPRPGSAYRTATSWARETLPVG